MSFLEWLKREKKALVIQGPQGCGKGLLARQLAEEAGTYSTTSIRDCAGFRPQWFNEDPKTLIFEEAPKMDSSNTVGRLINAKEVIYYTKGEDPITMARPMLIFCTSDTGLVSFGVHDTKFFIIKMGLKEVNKT